MLPPPPCSSMHYALSTMHYTSTASTMLHYARSCTCGEKPGSVTEGSGWRWYLCKKLDTDPLPDAFISSPHRHKCHMLRWTSGVLLHKGGWQVVCLCKQEQAKPERWIIVDTHSGWFPEQVNSFWSSQRLTGGVGSYHRNNTWEKQTTIYGRLVESKLLFCNKKNTKKDIRWQRQNKWEKKK